MISQLYSFNISQVTKKMGCSKPRKKQAISMVQLLGPMGALFVGVPAYSIQVSLPSSTASSPVTQTDTSLGSGSSGSENTPASEDATVLGVDCLPQDSLFESSPESQGLSTGLSVPPLASAPFDGAMAPSSTVQPFVEADGEASGIEGEASQPLLAQAEFADPLCCQGDEGPASCFLGGVPEGAAQLAGGFPFLSLLGAAPFAGLFTLLDGDDGTPTSATGGGGTPGGGTPGGGTPSSVGDPGGIGDPGGGGGTPPVPEPLSMAGPLVALVFGTYLKRRGFGQNKDAVD